MKSLFLKIFVFLSLILTLPSLVTAQSLGSFTEEAGRAAGYDVDVNEEGTGIARIAGTIVRTFISLLGILFISYTIYGGFLWMTAAGNEEKLTKAKSILRNGIIGIIIVLSSVGIYWIVAQYFIYGSLGTPRDAGTATFF